MSSDRQLYVIPQTVLLRSAPSGALQVHPASASAPSVSRELVPLLLLFARPQSIDGALAAAADEWEMERGEFERLVELERLVQVWLRSGLLAAAPDRGSYVPSRLQTFQRGFDKHRVSPTGPFPLRSHLDLQNPVVFYPGLDTRELHDPRAFPWVPRLEAAYGAIREELLALLASDSLGRVNRDYTTTGEWAAAYLWVFGEEVEGITAQCPETARVLQDVPGVTSFGTSFFSGLAPGTFLAPHYGYTNAKLRCQLPLIVPGESRLKVGEIEIEQQEGRCLVFDDSFLHSAWNGSTEPRYALIIDFFHPDLTDAEVAYLSSLSSEQKLGAPYLQQAARADRAAWTHGERKAGGSAGR